MKLRPSALVSTQKRIPFVVGSPLQTTRCLKRPVHVTRNPSSHDCAILSLTVEGPKMCAFYSPPEGVKSLCGTAEAPTRFPSSRLRVFTQVCRRGRGSSIDELWGHQHDSRPGAKPSWLSTLEESYIIFYLIQVTESIIRLMSLTCLYIISYLVQVTESIIRLRSLTGLPGFGE